MNILLILAVCLLFCSSATSASAAGFEAPPAPFQTSPRPADGETVAANPPCFVYPADHPYESYAVELSTDPAFPPAATTRLTSPYMLTTLTAPLSPGGYAWRWRPDKPDDGGREWSPVRRFTVPAAAPIVPAAAPIVPFPDIDALVKRIGTSHPRVDVTAAGLADLRTRALRTYGDSWLAGVKKYAKQMRDKPLLPEPAFLPDAGDPRRIELYQKTFQTTRPFMGEMVTLAQNYLLTGDELSGQQAKRRLLHIIGWDPRGSTSLSHNDEPATDVVRHCPLVYDWIYPLLTAAERRRCLDCLLIRMTEMRDRWRKRPFEMYPYESHNMGYYLPDLLQASLALAGDAPVEEMLHYTMLQLWSPFYPPYGGADGGWCEGPSYWGWSTSVFAHTYHVVECATGVSVHLRSNVRNMAYYCLYGNPPYFKMAPFGDGQEKPAGNGRPMAMLASLYRNPYAKWYAERKNEHLGGLYGLLFDDGKVPSQSPDELPQGRAFFDVGLAAMHTVLSDPTSNVAMLFRSCPFGSISHAYADQNTFTLDAYGEPLIIASGYYQLYGCPHHREWTWQTKASNSVLVNGEGQSTRDWNARGRLVTFRTTPAGDYTVGDAHEAYPGKLDRFLRRIVFLRPPHTGGEAVVVIRDELAAPKPSTFQFLLHALHKMEVDPARQQVTIAAGAARCRVQYLAPQTLQFTQTDQFTVPPFRLAPNQWHLTATTVAPAVAADSLIVLQPYRNRDSSTSELMAAQTESGAGGIGVRLTAGNREIIVVFRTDGAAATCGGITTDAAAASVTLVDGQVYSVAMFEGTRLSFNGAELLAASAAATVSCTLRGADCRLVASTASAGTRLTAHLGGDESWTQQGDHFVRVIGSPESAGSTVAGNFSVEGQAAAPFTVIQHDEVQRVTATAPLTGPSALFAVQATVDNAGRGQLPVLVAAGGAMARQVLVPHQQDVVISLPPASLGGTGLGLSESELAITGDEAYGGALRVRGATARRAYGVNLLPNPSFEEVADGVPVGWTATSISNNAQAKIVSARTEQSAPGRRHGGKCLKVTCTVPSGDFGAVLAWPGIAPGTMDRKFRMSCWVKTDAASVAGIQVASADWQFWKNTDRLRGAADWKETSLEFVLPAGVDLTHVRLHMHAEQAGTELFVDDVSLSEVPDR